MFERFTDHTKWAIVLAQDEAHGLKRSYIGAGHLFLGFATEGEGIAAKVLKVMEVKGDAVHTYVIKIIGESEKAVKDHVPFILRAEHAFELSLRGVPRLSRSYIRAEYLLFDLLKGGEGAAT